MVDLVRGGRTPDSLSREFEPTAQSIWNWVRQAERVRRLTADTGESLIGRVLDAEQVSAARTSFGLDGGFAMTGHRSRSAIRWIASCQGRLSRLGSSGGAPRTKFRHWLSAKNRDAQRPARREPGRRQRPREREAVWPSSLCFPTSPATSGRGVAMKEATLFRLSPAALSTRLVITGSAVPAPRCRSSSRAGKSERISMSSAWASVASVWSVRRWFPSSMLAIEPRVRPQSLPSFVCDTLASRRRLTRFCPTSS